MRRLWLILVLAGCQQVARPAEPAPESPSTRQTHVDVSPSDLLGRLIEGDNTLSPTAEHQDAEYGIVITATLDLCVSPEGRVTYAESRGRPTEPTYEEQILAKVRSWRFQPEKSDTACVRRIALRFDTPPRYESDRSKSFPALRLIPLDHEGKPVHCQLDLEHPAAPCDIELKSDGTVFDRRMSASPVGYLRPGLTLLSARSGNPVFALRSDGMLIGTGPVHDGTDHAQVLFCRLHADPRIECEHDIDRVLLEQGLFRNADNCGQPSEQQWTVTANGNEIVVHFFVGLPEETTTVVAQVEPPPANSGENLVALYLYAMMAVQSDTTVHAPEPPH